MKKAVKNEALRTWKALNEAILKLDDEAQVRALLAEEKAGRRRKQFMLRIHSRLNRIRADHERTDLTNSLRKLFDRAQEGQK